MTDAKRPAALMSMTSGRLLVLAAAVMWSTSGFFAKAPIFDGWPGPVLAFWRAVFASAVLLPMVRRPRFSWRLVPLVALFAVMNYSYLTAMKVGEASLAIWMQNTAPVWVFLFGVLVLRETVQPRDWLLVVLAGCGVGLIVVCEARGQSLDGALWGLLSGLTYAGIVLCLRWLRDFESAWLVALAHLGTIVCLSPWVVQFEELPSGEQWLYLAAFGMLQMGIPYLLFARGLQSIAGHEASGIALLEPILVPVWVFLAWHNAPGYEAPRWWTLVGGALILFGLLCRYFRLKRRPVTPPVSVED
ncbi:MAG: EamA family transporter [Pirellulaceae bacterium]